MTVEEKMIKVAENWMSMIDEAHLVAGEASSKADEAREIAISSDSVASNSLQYWRPNTLFNEGQIVYVRMSADVPDFIYRCITTHTSADYFTESMDDVVFWVLVSDVYASTAEQARYATNAERDSNGDLILTTYAKKTEIDTRIGDIETALDELHTYAQALVNGGVAE